MYIFLVYIGAEKNPVFSFLHPLTKIYIISLRQNDFERRKTDHTDVLTSLITASSGPPQPSGLPRKPVPQRRSSLSPKSPHHQTYRMITVQYSPFKATSRFSILTPFLSPYWVYVFAMCICLHFQSFSRHLSYLSCTLWNSWSVTYKLPFFLASFCSDWNLAMPQRNCFPWGFRKVWLFFLPQPLYPWFEDFDPYLPLDSCVSL